MREKDIQGRGESEVKKKLGEEMREARKGMGLSLRELARRVKLSAMYLCDIELGRRYPSVRSQVKISHILHVNLEIPTCPTCKRILTP